jgi:hypothetical protein
MICFAIPQTRLRLFLVAANMNFGLPEPDYIFQVQDWFEVVFLKLPSDHAAIERIDKFVNDVWTANGKTPPPWGRDNELIKALPLKPGFGGDQ